MPSPSKNKGNRFEREVAQLLTDALQVGEFQRTKGSGAFYGKSNQTRLKTASQSAIRAMRGDIIPPDDIDLVVECKNHKSFPGGFHSILYGESKQLDQWLSEVYSDSQNNKIPNFLVFKITGTGGLTFLALPHKHFKSISYQSLSHAIYISPLLNNTKYIIIESWALYELAQEVVSIIKQ